VFVDVISVNAVLYTINLANCYQNGPQKATKEAKEGREAKKAITIGKKKEIDQKYENSFRVTDLANMYSMSKSTLFYYEKVR
jgi:hypothetical protein